MDQEDQKSLKEKALAESIKRFVVGTLADAEDKVGYSLPSYRLRGDLGKLPCLSPCSFSPWLSFTSEGARKDLGFASLEHVQPLEGLRKAKDYGRVKFSCFWSALGFFHPYPQSQDTAKALCCPVQTLSKLLTLSISWGPALLQLVKSTRNGRGKVPSSLRLLKNGQGLLP